MSSVHNVLGLVLGAKVARVPVFGSISSWSRTDELLKLFRQIEVSSRYRAAVLDLDCPGGSISNFEYLYRALVQLRSAKPLVAHIRGVGASGGYLLASAASRIVAMETSLVGSIGVVSARPIMGDLLERLGVRMDVTKCGELKDMWAFYRDPTDHERSKQQAVLDACYEWFLARIAESRHLAMDQIRELATGEVFTTSQAMNLGLVDEQGDINRAIEIAAREAGIRAEAVAVKANRPMFERAIGVIGAHLTETVEAAISRPSVR